MAWIATAVTIGTAVIKGGAAKSAAATQAAAGDRSIAATRESEAQAREDLSTFREAGQREEGNINRLLNDPQAQKDFITNNPFFTALADDAQRRIFQNKAAKGKIGSGGTAEALQNSILLLGEDLLSRDISRRGEVANRGANAAARSANVSVGAGRDVAETTTQIGNVQAAGQVGVADAITEAGTSVVDLIAQKDRPSGSDSMNKVKI